MERTRLLVESSMKDLICVYRMLEDEVSRDIYLNRVNYLVSGDKKYITNIVTTHVPNLPLLCGKSVEELLSQIPRDKGLVLFGAGRYAEENLNIWAQDKRFIGFCSSTEEKQKNGFLGYPVMSPEKLLARKDLGVVISTTNARDEIMQILREGQYPEELIFDLAPYIVTQKQGQYFNPPFITYSEEEVFVDAGCYDMGSALELKKRCGTLKKVYAFEPDPGNYKRCLTRKSRMTPVDVKLLPVGTWSERKTLHFDALSTGSSHVAEDLSGTVSVPVMPIDEAVDLKEKITFIKMDVEGAELESLKGARKTIQRDKPKLAVCIYHKPEDMIEIPLYIKRLVPEYKLYVRHHSNSTGETVLYAVIS